MAIAWRAAKLRDGALSGCGADERAVGRSAAVSLMFVPRLLGLKRRRRMPDSMSMPQ